MKNNQESNLKKINTAISILQIFLLIVAITMLFLPAIRGINDHSNTYSGFDIVFGKKVTTTVLFLEVTYTVLELSILNLIPYIIIALGVSMLTLSIFLYRRNNILLDGVQFLLFTVGGVFMLNVVKLSVPGKDIQEFLSIFGTFNLSDYFEIAIGAIISAVTLFLTAILSLCRIVILGK